MAAELEISKEIIRIIAYIISYYNITAGASSGSKFDYILSGYKKRQIEINMWSKVTKIYQN